MRPPNTCCSVSAKTHITTNKKAIRSTCLSPSSEHLCEGFAAKANVNEIKMEGPINNQTLLRGDFIGTAFYGNLPNRTEGFYDK